MTPQVQSRGYVHGFRWMGLKEFVFDAAAMAGVRVDFEPVDRGVVLETVWFTVKAVDSDAIERFYSAIERYQR